MFSKAQENLEYVTVSSLLYVNIFEILPLQKKKKLRIVEKYLKLQNFRKYKISTGLYNVLEASKDIGKVCMMESMLTFDIIFKLRLY